MNKCFITIITALLAGILSWVYDRNKGEKFNAKHCLILIVSAAAVVFGIRLLATAKTSAPNVKKIISYTKISDLANELGISPKVVGNKLRDLGIFEKSAFGRSFDFKHNSKFLLSGWEMNSDAVNLVRKAFKK